MAYNVRVDQVAVFIMLGEYRMAQRIITVTVLAAMPPGV
jgi:hypothetical protein